MGNNLKRAMITAALPILTASMLAGSDSLYDYGFGHRSPRATTAEENSFVEKQGYKTPGDHDRAEQYRRRLKRKDKNYKGHKHGGARR